MTYVFARIIIPNYHTILLQSKTYGGDEKQVQHMPEIRVYLSCLSDFLTFYKKKGKLSSLMEHRVKLEKNIKQIYDILVLTTKNFTNSNVTVTLEAVELLQEYMNFFIIFVKKDYQYWHRYLLCIMKPKNNVDACFKSFYEILGQTLTEEDNEIFLVIPLFPTFDGKCLKLFFCINFLNLITL